MRPSGPDPVTSARSTPSCSAAFLAANGVVLRFVGSSEIVALTSLAVCDFVSVSV